MRVKERERERQGERKRLGHTRPNCRAPYKNPSLFSPLSNTKQCKCLFMIYEILIKSTTLQEEPMECMYKR